MCGFSHGPRCERTGPWRAEAGLGAGRGIAGGDHPVLLAAETTQPKKPPTSTATRRKLFKHLQGGKTPDHHRPPSPPAPSAGDPAAARAWYGRGRHGWCGGPGSLLRRVFRPLQKPSTDPYFYHTSFPPLFAFSAVGTQRAVLRARERLWAARVRQRRAAPPSTCFRGRRPQERQRKYPGGGVGTSKPLLAARGAPAPPSLPMAACP